jgi:Tfp pilus assembly protein PilN
MIKVNLGGAAKKRAAKAVTRSASPTSLLPLLLLLIIAGTAVGGYYWYTSLKSKVDELDLQVAAADKKVKELDQIIKMDLVAQARKAALEDRIKIIDGLKGNQVSPVVSLDMLGNAIDRTQFVWLASLDQNNTTFTMTGTGTSVEALADFVTNLENTGYFRNIDLKRFEDSRGNFTFNMTCEFFPPTTPKPIVAPPPTKGGN